MKALRNIQRDEVDLSVSVFFDDMATDKFIALLLDLAGNDAPPPSAIPALHFPSATPSAKYSLKSQERKIVRSVELFHEFINAKPTITGINPSEKLLAEFLDYLIAKEKNDNPEAASKNDRSRYWVEFAGCVRVLINKFPKAILRRSLLSPAECKAQSRFDYLNKECKAAVMVFLKNGKIVKYADGNPIQTSKPLADGTKLCALDATKTILTTLGLTDLKQLTDSELERFHQIYAEKDMGDTALCYFIDAGTFYRYLHSTHFISDFPSKLSGHKPKRRNDDYVPAENIAKLEDRSTVEWNDFFDIQDRFICYVLLYDFALRAGEALRLTIDDISVSQCVDLHLPSEAQKGQNKPEQWLFNYFEISKLYAKRFLQLREAQFPNTKSLLVNSDGGQMLEGVLTDCVSRHCNNLGIVTQNGKSTSPHRLRHSFATLNIESLGLKLSIYEISERLRHEDIKTTKDVYIARNPLILKERHLAKMKQRNGQGQTYQPQSHHIDTEPTTPPTIDTAAVSIANDTILSEDAAMNMLSQLGIKPPALLKAAKVDGKVSLRDGLFYYSMAYIEDLKSNWVTKQYAASVLNMTEKQLWHWLKKNGVETKTIGKASLIRASGLFKGLHNSKRKSA
ncbi:MAG: site-specific integrase [bacterium]